MTLPATDLNTLRRMIGETSSSVYTDPVLQALADKYTLLDANGAEPADEGWVPTYDLNAIAADVWAEKATAVQRYYDFQADGARYSQSQLFESAMEQSRYFSARRKPVSRTTFKKPDENSQTSSDEGLIYDAEYAWWRV